MQLCHSRIEVLQTGFLEDVAMSVHPPWLVYALHREDEALLQKVTLVLAFLFYMPAVNTRHFYRFCAVPASLSKVLIELTHLIYKLSHSYLMTFLVLCKLTFLTKCLFVRLMAVHDTHMAILWYAGSHVVITCCVLN